MTKLTVTGYFQFSACIGAIGSKPANTGSFRDACLQRTAAAQSANAVPIQNSTPRIIRLKYAPSFVEMSMRGCIAHFNYSDGTPWDASEMTQDEWDYLYETMGTLASGLGLDPARLPLVLLSPDVCRRMGDDSYAELVYNRIDNYLSVHSAAGRRLVMDGEGILTDLDAGKDKALSPGPEQDGEDLWKTRLERQAEYMRFVQEKAAEHRLQITREFARLRGFAQGSEAAQGLSGTSHSAMEFSSLSV